MSPFVFALKRGVQRPLFIGMLILYVIAVAFAGNVSREISLPAAGVFDGSKSVESGRIVSHLKENGFIECENPETMLEMVRKGQLDCGVILPENLVLLMSENDLYGCIPWIVAPTSFIPELYKDHVAAALFREYTPYITAPLFEDTVVPREEVFQEYEKMFESGYAFSFDSTMSDGSSGAETANQRSLVMGVSAILLCAVMFALCADVAGTSFQETMNRVGLSKAITMSLLPSLIVRMVLIGCAGCIGLCLTDEHELILPLLTYIVLLAGIGVMLSGLLRNVRLIYTLLSLVVVGSVALCPIYTDVALISPALAVVRYAFPPYWMWLLPENRLIGAAVAIAVLLGGIVFLVIRYAAIGKYRLRFCRSSR